ncbi:MAG: SsrA-binding protein SmpB [Chloroflexi bacterium]|nr:SsrA-binding protein SmpB [Chloroflexota bacterium]MYD47064.1 SsrA-binding protein SmpB [Chloroflexota bacterium]
MARKNRNSKKKAAGGVGGDNRQIAVNRKALHDYEILDKVEAGLVLTGTEIKSLRAGKVDLRDAYARVQDGELWLHGAHIAPYDAGSYMNHEPRRPRKLLVHRSEIGDLAAQIAEKGLTLAALRIYLRNHHAKVELGVARGKRQYDKRRAIIDRERERAARQAMKELRD